MRIWLGCSVLGISVLLNGCAGLIENLAKSPEVIKALQRYGINTSGQYVESPADKAEFEKNKAFYEKAEKEFNIHCVNQTKNYYRTAYDWDCLNLAKRFELNNKLASALKQMEQKGVSIYLADYSALGENAAILGNRDADEELIKLLNEARQPRYTKHFVSSSLVGLSKEPDRFGIGCADVPFVPCEVVEIISCEKVKAIECEVFFQSMERRPDLLVTIIDFLKSRPDWKIRVDSYGNYVDSESKLLSINLGTSDTIIRNFLSGEYPTCEADTAKCFKFYERIEKNPDLKTALISVKQQNIDVLVGRYFSAAKNKVKVNYDAPDGEIIRKLVGEP